MASDPVASTLSDSEITAITVFSDIASSLSIIGSLFILYVYTAFPALRRLSFTLVAALAATDVLNQIFDLISPSPADLRAMAAGEAPTSSLCLAQAVGDSFFELASCAWTSCIAFLLYATVMWRWRLEDTWGTLARFAIPVFIFAAALTIAPWAAGVFGSSGVDCWIRAENFGWRLGSFFVPLWLIIAFNTAAYVRVFLLLRRTVRMAGANDAVALAIGGMMARLAVYPFILAIVWTLPSIAAIIEAAGGGQPFGLALVAATVAGLQGLFNALAYGFSPGVREALAATPLFGACCARCAHSCSRLCCTTGGDSTVSDNSAAARAVESPKLLAEGATPTQSLPHALSGVFAPSFHATIALPGAFSGESSRMLDGGGVATANPASGIAAPPPPPPPPPPA